jgi:uroporphyrinogen-III synthase
MTMGALDGIKVALLEGRKSGELEALIRRQGGEPRSVPAVREEDRSSDAEVTALLEALAREPEALVILSTGVGVEALFREADRLGRKAEMVRALGAATTLSRGPTPAAALKREGLAPKLNAQEPFTTQEILTALAPLQLKGHSAVVVHYGEPNPPLVGALEDRGARVLEILLYAWRLPEDVRPLESLVRELVAGQYGAVAFTNQVQVRHLFEVAAKFGVEEPLRAALRDKTVVAAVGPTCAAALEERGVSPQVVPEHPKMGAMVVALGQRFAAQRRDQEN